MEANYKKLLLKILVTQNMKNVISIKVRILGSNLFLTPLYILLIVWVMTTYEYFPLQRYKMPPLI
jgi:hypothetical protein